MSFGAPYFYGPCVDHLIDHFATFQRAQLLKCPAPRKKVEQHKADNPDSSNPRRGGDPASEQALPSVDNAAV